MASEIEHYMQAVSRLKSENADLAARLRDLEGETDCKTHGEVLTFCDQCLVAASASWAERLRLAEAEAARLRDYAELIARGVWIAPNAVESMVWHARQALRDCASLAPRAAPADAPQEPLPARASVDSGAVEGE